MRLTLDIDHMRSQCLHVFESAMLRLLDVSVTHQRDTITFDTDNAVQHIAPAFDPCHYDIANFWSCWLLQDDAITPTHNKREHAMPIHGQCHTLFVCSSPYGLPYDFEVAQHRQATTPASRSDSMVSCTSAMAVSVVTSYAATTAAAVSSTVLPACSCS